MCFGDTGAEVSKGFCIYQILEPPKKIGAEV